MTAFQSCCRKILAASCVVSLATTGSLAFQQQTIRQRPVTTTSYRPRPLDNKLVPGSQLNLFGENVESNINWRTSTALSVSLGRNKAGSIPSDNLQDRVKLGMKTIVRVVAPSILAGVVAFFAFPSLSLWLCSLFQDQGVFAVLSQDSSQFVQNFLSVSSLLFSILVGQTYYFMYQQQEMVYYALFDEVTEAKSLLEQVALVSQGRSMYKRVLDCMSTYVQSDLKALDKDPAVLLSSRPMDDPLETIMYLVSQV